MKMNRRDFLQTTLATAGAVAVPTIVPATVFGKNAPSNRINIAAIGVGSRGFGHVLHGFVYSQKNVRVVAACDCFKDRRERAAAKYNEHYKENVCTPMDDFREVLAREDVDGVVVSTPDHWHVPICYEAALAKKDIYVEKPLGVAMAWAMKLREAVQKNKVVFQYGTQQRSGDGFPRVVNLVRNGYIGKIKHVNAWCERLNLNAEYLQTAHKDTQEAAVPETLDYDRWIGPAPMKPYTDSRCTNLGAYHIYDYALGYIAGWGAHPLDIAQWGLNTDDTCPFKYEGTGTLPSPGLFDTVDSWDIDCEYANGVTMKFMSFDVAKKTLTEYDPRKLPIKDHGTMFVGDEGWIAVGRYGVYASDKTLQRMDIDPAKDTPVHPTSILQPSERTQGLDFVDCIKTRKTPISPLESAIRSDTISHMADICVRIKRPVQWDPEKEEIIGDAEAAKLLNRPMRKPWKM